tara:strand:- start:2867 stop:4324 length:1458 start_codon:yes stop_codon:yes gene_type:complete
MTCEVKLYRKRQVLGKIETGCAEPEILAAIDGGIEVSVSPQAEPEVQMNERDVARISLTNLLAVPGEVSGSLKFTHEFKGSGTNAKDPAILKYLEGCSMVKTDLKRIKIGAITPSGSGVTLKYGAVMSVSADAAKAGIVVIPYDPETSSYVYYERTGTGFASGDVITFTNPGTGAGTVDATSSAVEEDHGKTATFTSSNQKTMTLRSEEDGYKKEIYSAMGNFSVAADASGFAVFEMDYSGVVSKGYVADASITVDIAAGKKIVGASGAEAVLIRGVDGDPTPTVNEEIHYVYIGATKFTPGEALVDSQAVSVGVFNGTYENRGGFGDQDNTLNVVFDETTPPILQDAQLVIKDADGIDPDFKPVFSNVSLESGNEVILRKDGNSINGLRTARIPSRKPTISVDPEMMSEASFDIFNRWFDGSPASLGFKVGKGGDFNSMYIYTKKAQFTGCSDGDRDGVCVVTAEAMLAGDYSGTDDELKIVFY